ncbi:MULTISPECIES: class I SAM-dependent methyltransferase [Empedobacter]|uniref:class I SAM-dependent methyltransferase n=1 Tax=Empedobacter TaxID=59734 RepID=UPI000EDA8118|nr:MULTISPECIES: class I SAM-dependent methyltransferase [Empedobacter]MDM1042995.1 class I SAM-dependent methyltransferase [Empedobacter brevis]MDM1136925.1 class I SAM-dependent methyltransferase [Empedobacter sp. R750]HAD79317.1 ubiquinone biosynthesis protein [Flavobacteriaceae bacterium]
MNDIYDPTFVKKLFNKMSNSYERMNYITSFGFSIIWRKQFIKALNKKESKIKVIDLLSGLGENWSYLKNRFPNAEFYALDFSEEMVEKSRKKGKIIFQNKIEIFQDDILKNELKSEEFDIITCAFGLKTFNESQIDLLAKQVYRMLKKEGQFTFIEISKPQNSILYFLYSFYLGKIIPILGKLFLGNPDDYKMLWLYTKKFESCKKVEAIFKKNNLNVQYKEYFFGCASGIYGAKKA